MVGEPRKRPHTTRNDAANADGDHWEPSQRALRSDIALLCMRPESFPCKYPCAAWVARRHGVSRQRASILQREFARKFAEYLQFRSQRLLNQANAIQ